MFVQTIHLIMKNIFTLLIVIFLFSTNKVAAAQINACDISYQATSNKNIYKVNVKIYRDCSAEVLCAGCETPFPNGNTNGCTLKNAGFTTAIIGMDKGFEGINYGDFNLNIVTGISNAYDIVEFQKCEKINSICTNCNTRIPGTFKVGVEVYIFEGLVDLSSVPLGCCNIALGISSNSRNKSLTTIIPEAFYTECVINKCVENSSPTFTNDAHATICAGVDYIFELNPIDPDGDSLSYKMVPSFKAKGVPVSFVAPFSEKFPFPYFGPPNQTSLNLRIDPLTGNISFRPLGLFIANINVEVSQWRKIGNVTTLVGITNRDLQINTTVACKTNRIPLIKIYREGKLSNGSQVFFVQQGKQICLDIVAEDQADNTTTPPIEADTTDLKWNNPGLYNTVLANASFTRNYILNQRTIDGPKADSFKFCWTPPASAIRDLPHAFTVTGMDRNCPYKAYATRGINIKVGEWSLGIDNVNSELLKVFPNPANDKVVINYDALKTNHFELTIIDVLGKEVYKLENTEPRKNNELLIDLSALNNGFYTVIFKTNNGNYSQKLVKE